MSTARERFAAELGFTGDLQTEGMLQAVLDEHAHQLAERLRNVSTSNDGVDWNWWDAAEIPGSCADLIDPYTSVRRAGPVRPDEEPTP